MQFDEEGNYYPLVYFNVFWLLHDKLVPMNESVSNVTLHLDYGHISLTWWVPHNSSWGRGGVGQGGPGWNCTGGSAPASAPPCLPGVCGLVWCGPNDGLYLLRIPTREQCPPPHRWQIQQQMEKSFDMQRSMGMQAEGEADEIKRIFLEGNPYLLVGGRVALLPLLSAVTYRHLGPLCTHSEATAGPCWS